MNKTEQHCHIEQQNYLTITDASEYLNIKSKTLYAMAASGSIPHYKVGRLIRFKREEIDEWMDGKKAGIDLTDRKAEAIIKSIRNKSPKDIKKRIQKSIDAAKSPDYTVQHGKPDHIRGLRKEVRNGSL